MRFCLILLISLSACGDDDVSQMDAATADATLPPPDSGATDSGPPDSGLPPGTDPDAALPSDAGEDTMVPLDSGSSQNAALAAEIAESISVLFTAVCQCPDEGQTTEECVAEQMLSPDFNMCAEGVLNEAGDASVAGVECFIEATDAAVECLNANESCNLRDGCLAMWGRAFMSCPDAGAVELIGEC